MPLKDFNETFAYELRDLNYAAMFLDFALLDGGIETFLVAIKNVAQANGGMSAVAELSSLGRESMYKALSEDGNPRIKTVHSILKAMGLRLSVVRETAEEAAEPRELAAAGAG